MATITRVNRQVGSKPKPKQRCKTETRQVHDSRLWRDNIRPIFLKQNPLCVQCEAEGNVREATEVDHIKPIANGGARYDANNLQALCKHHHSKKTAQENRGVLKSSRKTL